MKDSNNSSFDEKLIKFLNEVKTKLPIDYKIPDPEVVNIILTHTQWAVLQAKNSYPPSCVSNREKIIKGWL